MKIWVAKGWVRQSLKSNGQWVDQTCSDTNEMTKSFLKEITSTNNPDYNNP